MNPYDTRYMQLLIQKIHLVQVKKLSVTQAAKDLNISRQTMSKWHSRYQRFGQEGLIQTRKQRQGPAHNRTSTEVEALVAKLARTYFTDGVETLHDHLAYEYNITLHPTTIYRILKRNNIRYTDVYTTTKRQWKKKLYAHQTPGTELQMDTKYPFGYKKGRVIYTIIDDASRFVYAYGYEKANQENTLDFIQRVQRNIPFPTHKIRTDQGREFIANSVKAYLASQGITYRNNTPYCPEENGKIERFHRTLNEKALPYGFNERNSLEDLQYRLNLFLKYYNYHKRHRGLGMEGLTPFQKLQEKASVNLTLQWYIF